MLYESISVVFLQKLKNLKLILFNKRKKLDQNHSFNLNSEGIFI